MRDSWVPALFLFSFAGCALPDPGSTLLIGHGGAGTASVHRLNSPASLEEGLAMGLDGVELDVQLSADGVLVAFHDLDLAPATTCAGPIHAMTFQSLLACNYADYDPGSKAFHRLDHLLPALAEAHPGADFTLDIKLRAHGEWWPYLEQFATALRELHALPALRGRLLVECMDVEFLLLVGREDPDLPRWLYAKDFAEGMATALQHDLDGLTVNHRTARQEQLAEARAQGLRTCLFGMRGRSAHRSALMKGPDRIQSDNPQLPLGARSSP